MRWDDQQVESEATRVLPGYREPATVRTFDAPQALQTRFYEVRSKSALNRVPDRSRMPFRWTVNPYRGCTHACSYCMGPQTPVLMADGRTKAIAELRAGDRIYGTKREGRYRRYVTTEIVDHWSSIKPAFRVTLADGTELVASGDHRFLTERGWKHVRPTARPEQRPYLTTANTLMGTGRFARSDGDWPDYRRGYLSGLIRGDGTIGTYSYDRPGRRRADAHRFRLALVDREALQRARGYLADMRVETQELAFSDATADRRAVRAIRTSSRDNVEAITSLIRWPPSPRAEWCKGFLAGIFDGEGSYSGSLRISNTCSEIIDWIIKSLRILGFSSCIEDYGPTDGLRTVRLLGGLPAALRFFHLTDPAITRKRSIEGTALKCSTDLSVSSVEPLGRGHQLFDITTGTGDFIANGVVSHNCFARPTHTYLGLDAGRDFEREIVVKVNVPEVLRAELKRPSWRREHVALGTNTDPYQWVESRYRLMPGVWEALRDTDTPGSILTKSPLLLRDLELMREVPGIRANLSIPTLEEKAWRATEPHTPHPRARIEAVAELNRNGIPCGVLIAPLMPGINDDPSQVEAILDLAHEAGAVDIGGLALHLRGEVRALFFDWLREHRPELIPRYERLYARGAYVPRAEGRRLSLLARGGTGRGVKSLRGGAGAAVAPPEPIEEPARTAFEQDSLF